jgi:hypothetical protein
MICVVNFLVECKLFKIIPKVLSVIIMKRRKQQILFALWEKFAKGDRPTTDDNISSYEKFTTSLAVETSPSPVVANSLVETADVFISLVEGKSCPLPPSTGTGRGRSDIHNRH